MHRLIRLRQDWRHVAAGLALLALLVRAFVPMAAPDLRSLAGKTTEIVICTLMGEQHILLDADGNPIPAGQDNKGAVGHSSCPCVTPAGWVPPVLAVILLPPTPTNPHVLPEPAHDIPDPPARTAWQSRAPPHHSRHA